MKFVEIYKLTNDGSQKIIATCEMEKDEVSCNGDENFVNGLKTNGIPNYSKSEGEKIFPRDGIKFLENLKFVFKSGYLNASDVKEK